MTLNKSLSFLSIDAPLDKYVRHKVLWHILFWVCYVLYEGVIWGMVDDAYGQRLYISLLELPIKIAATYFTIYFLIDRYLLRKKYQQFFIYLPVLVFVGILRVLAYKVIYPMYYPEILEAIPMLWPPKMLIAFFYIYSVTAIVSTFHLLRHILNNEYNGSQINANFDTNC
jgi:hypothetical protein